MSQSRGFDFRLLLAALVGAGAATAVALWTRPAPPLPALPPYTVDKTRIAVNDRSRMPVRIETAKVAMREPLVSSPVSARVTTIESRTAPSYAPLDGRIAEVRVRLGDHVKQGDRLLLVRSADLAVLEKEQKGAALAIATKQALTERLRQLVDSRAAPSGDLLVAETELNEAKLTADAAGQKIRSLGVMSQAGVGYWVLATRSGTIVQIDAQPGKQVGPDRDHPVATIADLDEVLVLADVPQKDADHLTADGGVEITTPGDSGPPIKGTIELISEVVDPDRQTVPVRIRVPNQGHRLRSASFVEARFASSSKEKVPIIPAAAVVSDGAGSVVFTTDDDGKTYLRRAVKIARRTATEVEIRDGLGAADTIVTEGALLLLSALGGVH